MLSCKLIGAFYFCNFLIAEMIAALHFLQSYGMITLYNFSWGEIMENKQPPFEITAKMIDDIAEIAMLVGQITGANHLSGNPTLRRTNRIRTVHGSLAIEQNTLSLEQVTAVLNGKRVLAPPKDIAEVKNAYEIYERLDTLNPYSVDDLLTAHGVMTRGLVEESGVFRSGNVGVVDNDGQVLHFGTLPDYVPGLVSDLLSWAKDSGIHMLIRSCVVHYELEVIHPFADGNGRVGRLWHTLMLSKWNPIFAWLPVESIIHDRQQEYYDAINASNNMAESTPFITFMLSAIRSSITETIAMTDEVIDEPSSKEQRRWMSVRDYMKDHDAIQNAAVCVLLNTSSATANRLLRGWVEEGKLERFRDGKIYAYRLATKKTWK